MIIVDTREQVPIWNPDGPNTLRLKLDEGDYTTTELINIAHIERKSGIDLYGNIIQGHKRFRSVMERANEKNLTLAVFVECPKEKFIAKRFKGGFRLKAKPDVLRKIVTTIQDKYGVEFIWCDDRKDFKRRAIEWFNNQERINHGKITADKKSKW
jgi:ERCC4-type nuclease